MVIGGEAVGEVGSPLDVEWGLGAAGGVAAAAEGGVVAAAGVDPVPEADAVVAA